MAERMALNAPIQGTAADMIKCAMVHLDQMITDQFNHDDVRIILQIHDEIIYEVKGDMVDDFITQALEIMQHIIVNSYLDINNPVPLVVHASHGSHWGELK